MKKVYFLLFSFLLLGCTNPPSIEKVMVDGECLSESVNLTIIKSLSIGEFEKEIERIYKDRIPSMLIDEIAELRLASRNGALIYEISSDGNAWKGLYGSWGFGTVKENCLLHYLEVIAS